MTREDAIDYNKNLKMYMKISDKNNPCKFLEENYIALDMAVEALKEMSVEEYRQRLMEVFHRTDHDELITYVVMPKEEEFKSLEYILQKQPFEPRPHGEWIVQRLQNGFDDVYCPFCKARPTRSEYGYYLRDNFCHECGADMRLRILDEADDGAGKDGNVKEGETE